MKQYSDYFIKKEKNIGFRCLMALSIVVLLLGCSGNSAFRARLIAMDSLLVEHPDSIYKVLCGLEAEVSHQSYADRMYYELLRADAQNKAYVDFTTDSVMQEVTKYYDDNGTPNEQMRAHYLLGCTYRDMKDVPMELQCFLDATEKADTASKDCDLHTLISVYGQMADLYHSQYVPDEEIKTLSICEELSIKAKDTLTSIIAYEMRLRAYFFKNMPDSVLSITEKVREMYLIHGLKNKASCHLGGAINILIDRGEYKKAEYYMHEYENNSGFFDEHGNILPDKTIYFYDKGRYALLCNRVDSAIYYFRKLLPLEKECAYKGLMSVYHKTGNTDSIVKYSNLYALANDSSFLDNNAQIVEQMTARFNYERQQQEAEKHKRKSDVAQQKLWTSLLFFILVILIISLLAIRLKRNNDKKIAHAINSYYEVLSQKEIIEKDIDNLKSLQKSEIENIQKQHKSSLIEKEKELQALQYQVDYYSGKLDLSNSTQTLAAFMETKIFKKLKSSIRFKNPEMKLVDSEWRHFDTLYSQYFPKYYKFISTNNRLNQDEILVCLLLRFNLSTKELSSVLSKSMSRISNIRASINKKLFNSDSASTLNDNLRRVF